jgi:2-polyprenyl-3-methyl-5-hydroxy-6-metoxy-1,4-benzoquinol methylase
VFVHILLLCVLAAVAPAQDADRKIWDDYQSFIQGRDGPEAAAAYRAKLIAGGMTEQQAWDRLFLIDKLRPKFQQDVWTAHFNRLYTSEQDVFTAEPNAFLAAVVRDMKPGTALDVSMGQGRNTVFLAQKGWQATGFDPAEDGLKVAQAAAAKAGVRITTVKAGYEEFEFGKERWDLIVFCYSFAPLSDPELVKRVHGSLKPGGTVLIEHPMNDPETAMHPQDMVNSLPRAFANGFRIVFYEDTTGLSEWQQSPVKRSEDKRRMVRFVARKYK